MARRGSTFLTWAVVVAGLAAGSTIAGELPKPQDVIDAPVEHRGGVGDTVELRHLHLTLEGVQTAKQIKGLVGASEAAPGTVFLLVDVVVSPTRETAGLGATMVQSSDGRLFGGPPPQNVSCRGTQPLLRTRCQQAVEVAVDALAGARLLLPAQPFTEGVGDDVAVFDLGIDDARAAELAATTAAVEPREPEALA